MFAGIVSAIGEVASVSLKNEVRRLEISAPRGQRPFDIGSSVCCSGICLTVVAVQEAGDFVQLTVDLGAETLKVTTAANWETGTRLNLERALRAGDELGGHLLAGHVDGVAIVIDRADLGETLVLRFAAPDALAKFIAPKGSVALDGTSLTVNQVKGAEFDCLLVPHTLAATTWLERQKGDGVNLEADLLARYVDRLLPRP